MSRLSKRTIDIGETLCATLKEARQIKKKRLRFGGDYIKCCNRSIRSCQGRKNLLIESSTNIKELLECLGHADIATTMNRYVHDTDTMRQETVDIFEQAMRLS